jgi:hypothetical protein
VLTTEERGQEEGGGTAIGGPCICLTVEGGSLVRLCASAITKLVRRPAWEVPMELARRPTSEVVASRFALLRSPTCCGGDGVFVLTTLLSGYWRCSVVTGLWVFRRRLSVCSVLSFSLSGLMSMSHSD